MLGVIAEQVGRKPLAALYTELVTTPLGMAQTSLPVVGRHGDARPAPARLHVRQRTSGQRRLHAALAGTRRRRRSRSRPARSRTTSPSSRSNGQASGGAISTLGDMAIWAKALGTGQLLTPRCRPSALRYGAGSGYGLGLERTPSGLVGHDGAVPGFQSSVYFQPPTGASIVVLDQPALARTPTSVRRCPPTASPR